MTPEAAIAALDRAVDNRGEWATIRRRRQHKGTKISYFSCRVRIVEKTAGGYDFAGGVIMKDANFWLSPTQLVNARFPWPLRKRDIVALDRDKRDRHIQEPPVAHTLAGTIVRYEFSAQEVGDGTV